MILLCGIPSETPLAMVREELDKLNAPYVMFNQRHFATTELSFEISGGWVTGKIRLENQQYHLENFSGVYTRLMDDQLLPELKDEPPSPKRRYCRNLHDTLLRWYEVMPGRVVNRTASMGSNFSKPYQAQLIRQQGFAVPETLITNDPDLVREFRNQHLYQVIYKSISGIRSIVQMLEDKDLNRLDRIRWCPTQFQQFVEGTNVRVHVVNTAVFATAISTDATDYRYAKQQGGEAELRAVELSDELAEKCIKLAAALGLAFAGIDLKITPDNQVFCFEVNPSPAFSYYEAHTGQPIAQAVARYLAGIG